MQNTPTSQASEIEAIQTLPELSIEGRGVILYDRYRLVDHRPNTQDIAYNITRDIARDVNRTPT
jgi:hypothetical protein